MTAVTTTITSKPNPTHNRADRARTARRQTLIALIVVTAFMLATTACSFGQSAQQGEPDLVANPVFPGDNAESDGNAPAVGDTWVDSSTRAVVTDGVVNVSETPGGPSVLALPPTTAFGTTRVLLVEDQQDGWLKVRLPVRPNHRTGWIPADGVLLENLELEVWVDLEQRALVVRDQDQALLTTPVAVGTADNPTPTGTFYITDKLETPEPAGAYGPYAFGLSGHSETLTEFAGGDGQIGLHGTNVPESIGTESSHGCIRVPNDVIEQLADLLPLGTPVHIV
jgi:lipoprotein-anchoring transpeptidase ErfK/SrfK